jgi:hypothetical protein
MVVFVSPPNKSTASAQNKCSEKMQSGDFAQAADGPLNVSPMRRHAHPATHRAIDR